jgi:hypothetical protein
MNKKHVSPNYGGCWFCQTEEDTGDWLFSFEFDTYFHHHCLLEALREDHENEDTQIIAQEFNIKTKE